MAMTRRDMGYQKTATCSLREEAARLTVSKIHHQGHPYIELREDGKRFIFFCTLCLSPCYSETILFDHLRGNLHKERYTAAKVTLFGPNPWPFDDGVFFFCTFPEKEQTSEISNSQRNEVMNSVHENFGIVVSSENHDTRFENSESDFNSRLSCYNSALVLKGTESSVWISSPVDEDQMLDIPGVLLYDDVSILKARPIGVGYMGSRIGQTDATNNVVSKIWCAWLGKGSSDEMSFRETPDSDFSIITFRYSYYLGRKPNGSDLNLLHSIPHMELQDRRNIVEKEKDSFAEPEKKHRVMGDLSGSTETDCLALIDSRENALLMKKDSTSKALTCGQFNQVNVPNKAHRRELRRKEKLAAGRMCDVCLHKMLPGKDVAALLNRKTGNLACSSRNTNGAFHVFHISCLIHWVLLCEFERLFNQSSDVEKPTSITAVGSRKRRAVKSGKTKTLDGKNKAEKSRISSIFCPECQGTGINVEDELQNPTVLLSEVFRYKIKAIDSHKAWMKNPEHLPYCSTGLLFPCSSEQNIQEKVLTLKKLHFYQAWDKA